MDKRDSSHSSYTFHGLRHVTLGTIILGSRTSPCVPARIAYHAIGYNRCWLCSKLLSAIGMRLLPWLG